jgi:hypothetical protein
MINHLNSNDFICKLISYLRYVIRLISSFLIMAFTLQRLFVVYNPLKNKVNINIFLSTEYDIIYIYF